jgi:DNA-binding transcriptional regulator GbsR (MarR family)
MSVPNTADDSAPLANAAEAVDGARQIVGETVAELMGFWNFKPSMGRVWTALFLSPTPLSADVLVTRTGLSVGSVSMTLADLREWGVVIEVEPDKGRRRFTAETDMTAMVTRVFRQRELKLISDAVERFSAAVELLDTEGRSSHPGQMMEGRFVATRVRHLLALSKAGHRMIDQLVRVGRIDIGLIKNKLERIRS